MKGYISVLVRILEYISRTEGGASSSLKIETTTFQASNHLDTALVVVKLFVSYGLQHLGYIGVHIRLQWSVLTKKNKYP